MKFEEKQECEFKAFMLGMAATIIAVIISLLLNSCASLPIEAYDPPQYMAGGCYEIRDTVIVDTFLIGRPCE